MFSVASSFMSRSPVNFMLCNNVPHSFTWSEHAPHNLAMTSCAGRSNRLCEYLWAQVMMEQANLSKQREGGQVVGIRVHAPQALHFPWHCSSVFLMKTFTLCVELGMGRLLACRSICTSKDRPLM